MNHKNYGNQRSYAGGSATEMPVLAQTPVSTRYGYTNDCKHVLMEFSKPISNMHMTPDEVDSMVEYLRGAKAAMIEAGLKKATAGK